MDKFYHFLTLASIILYWILVAGVTLRVVLKRRAVSVSLAWLMIIYILPIVGVGCYFLFGELNLGRKRAERAKEMFGPFEQWFAKLNDSNAHQVDHLAATFSELINFVTTVLAFLPLVETAYPCKAHRMKY